MFNISSQFKKAVENISSFNELAFKKEGLKSKYLEKSILDDIDVSEENLESLDLEKIEKEVEIDKLGNSVLERLGISDVDIEKINLDRVLKKSDFNEVDENQKKETEKFELKDDKLDQTNQMKGNYGEMKTDQELKEKGYERISLDVVENLEDPLDKGIDGVYYNPEGDPQYLIVESKFGQSKLSETADGKQMSEKWIDNRLDEAVGKEMADEIRLEDPDNVGRLLSNIDENGEVEFSSLDGQGNIIERDVEINA